LLDKPSVSIDRVTGHIDVEVFGQPIFGGECRSYDAAARKF